MSRNNDSSVVCAAGHANRSGALFCTVCGQPIGGAIAPGADEIRILPPTVGRARRRTLTAHSERNRWTVGLALAVLAVVASAAAVLVATWMVDDDLTTKAAVVSKEAEEYGTLTDLRDAATAAGVSCDGWELLPEVNPEASGPTDPLGVGRCGTEEADALLILFPDHDSAKTLISGLDQSDGPPLLLGANWVITGPDVPALKREMGGSVVQPGETDDVVSESVEAPDPSHESGGTEAPSIDGSALSAEWPPSEPITDFDGPACPVAPEISGALIECAAAQAVVDECDGAKAPMEVVRHGGGTIEWARVSGSYAGNAVTSADLDLGPEVLSCGDSENGVDIDAFLKDLKGEAEAGWGFAVTSIACSVNSDRLTLVEMPIGQAAASCVVSGDDATGWAYVSVTENEPFYELGLGE